MTTCAPLRAKARAIANPSPAPPPVTIATLPANSRAEYPRRPPSPQRLAPARSHGIAWNRFASALIRFAVSMSRSVIFMPASWVQNENDRML